MLTQGVLLFNDHIIIHSYLWYITNVTLGKCSASHNIPFQFICCPLFKYRSPFTAVPLHITVVQSLSCVNILLSSYVLISNIVAYLTLGTYSHTPLLASHHISIFSCMHCIPHCHLIQLYNANILYQLIRPTFVHYNFKIYHTYLQFILVTYR